VRRHRVTFQLGLEPDEGGFVHHGDRRELQRHDFSEYALGAEDIYAEVPWDAQMTVFARSQVRRSY
jgi:hypothetical protein